MSIASNFSQLSNRTFNYLRLQFADKTLQLAHYYGLGKEDIAIVDNQLHLKKFNLKIVNDHRGYFLLTGYKYLLLLKEQLQATLINDNGTVIIRFNNLELAIETEADIYVLNEIYIEGVYNFTIPSSCLIIDIGLNVGFASLFFAGNKKVEKVFSFEPLKPTYAQAQKNLKRNAQQALKIVTYNYGISNKEQTLEIDYSYEWKGSVGIAGFPSHLQGKVKTEKQLMQLKPISDVFDIVNAYSENKDIGIKIDCEGAEYEIIPELVLNPNFNKVKFLMIEWHFKGPDALVEQLTLKGFNCFSFNPFSKGGGMIYATRITKQ